MLLVLALSVTNGQAESPIRVQVQPKIAQAPSDVHVRIWVERQPANRELVLLIDGPNYSRTSSYQLDGEAAPRVWDVWRQQLPCGAYQVVAQVRRNDGSSNLARDTLRIVGFDCPTFEPDPFSNEPLRHDGYVPVLKTGFRVIDDRAV